MTSSPSDALEPLQRAIDQLAGTIDRARPDQANQPTPCADFDLRALINHILYDLRQFEAMLSGADPGPPGQELLGDQPWSGAYRAAADNLLTTWRRRGTDGTITNRLGEFPATWGVGQHTTNLTVHAWDVARATDQSTDLDTDLAQRALEWGRANLKPEFRRPGTFDAEVSVPDTAPIYDRLVGWFGRNPAWPG
jgi:uncharacterized protein (TIGR03086 family)